MSLTPFRKLLHDRLLAQAGLFATFTRNTTLTGGSRERALQSLLREMLPRQFEVLAGSIATSQESGDAAKLDRQIDLMIVDTLSYPVFVREGDSAIVLGESVRAIVEVKSVLDSEREFLKAMAQIGALRAALGVDARAIPVCLFAYEAASESATLRGWFATLVQDQRSRYEAAQAAPNADRDAAVAKQRNLEAIVLPEIVVSGRGHVVIREPQANAPGQRYGFYTNPDGADSAAAVLYMVNDLLDRTRPIEPDARTARVARAYDRFSRLLGTLALVPDPLAPPIDLFHPAEERPP